MHTKEPWIVTGSDRIKYIEARTVNGMLQEIASCLTVSEENGNHEENARRIVACVNACAGLSTEHLEHINLFEQNSKAWAAATKAAEQRDELLAALKEVKKALDEACFIQPSPITDTLWMTKSETLFDFIDAAIAKADLTQ